MGRVFDSAEKLNLKPGQLVTLLKIADHVNSDGSCWPSVEHIARQTNQNEKTIRRHLQFFVDSGLLDREHRAGTGRGRKTNVYRLKGILSDCPEGQKDISEGAKGHQVSVSPPIYTNHQYKPSISGRPSGFDLFWSAYPRKVKKKQAREIWNRKRLDEQTELLVADVQNRIATDGQWAEGFTPHPTTYLNGERWNDEIEPVRQRAEATGRRLTFDEIREQQERSIRELDTGQEVDQSVVATF